MSDDEQIKEEEKALKSVERNLRKLMKLLAGKHGHMWAADAFAEIEWFREVRMERVRYQQDQRHIIADHLMGVWMPTSKGDAVMLDKVCRNIIKDLDDNERR